MFARSAKQLEAIRPDGRAGLLAVRAEVLVLRQLAIDCDLAALGDDRRPPKSRLGHPRHHRDPSQTTTAAAKPFDADATAPSETSAFRIAIRFLETDESLFPRATPAEARSLSDSLAATSARRRFGDRAEQHQRDILAKGDLEQLVLHIAPISARTRMYTDQRATVDVYFLRLWSFPSRGALDDYATARSSLRRSRPQLC